MRPGNRSLPTAIALILWTSLMVGSQGIVVGQSDPIDQVREALGPGVLPDIFLLKNEKGEPVLVPEVSFEQYEQFLQERDAERNGQAKIVLSRLELGITVEKDIAQVELRAQASSVSASKHWQWVPLAMSPIQWLPGGAAEPASGSNNPSTVPEEDGLDQISLLPQSSGGGYVWKISPDARLERKLLLRGAMKVNTSAGGSILKLDLPNVPTTVRLRLPSADWELIASGTGNELVEPFQVTEGYSEAITRSNGSSLLLNWKKRSVQDTAQAIEVISQTKFTPTPDGRQFRIATSLSIRGPNRLGGRRFLIQLPAGSNYREIPNAAIGFSGYRILRQAAEANKPEGENVPVQLSLELEEAIARNDIDIPLEWQLDMPTTETVRFAPPQIEGIQRHTGSIECVVPKNVDVNWQFDGEARLVRQSQATDGSDAIVYGFQFERQSMKLDGKWSLLTRKPRIQSEMLVELKGNHLVLVGSMEFQSDPLQLPLLQFEVDQWQLQRVTIVPTQNEIDLARLVQVDGTHVSLPIAPNHFSPVNPDSLRNEIDSPSRGESVDSSTNLNSAAVVTGSQPVESPIASGSLGNNHNRIEFQLTRKLDETGEACSFTLPMLSWIDQDTQKRISRSIAGRLLVQSHASDLIIDGENSKGLAVAPGHLLSAHSSTTHTNKLDRAVGEEYQLNESLTPQLWMGRRIRRAAPTMVTSSASLHLTSHSMEVQRDWACQSFNGVPASIQFAIPRLKTGESEAIEPTGVEFMLNGHPLPSQQIVDNPSVATGGTAGLDAIAYRCEIPLSFSGSIERFLLTAKFRYDGLLPLSNPRDYALSFAEVYPDSGLAWQGADKIRVQATTDGSVIGKAFAEQAMGDGISIDSATAIAEFDVSFAVPLLSLRVAPMPTRTSAIRVTSAWLQSVFNAVNQQDRFVVRFETDREQVVIELPGERVISETEFMVNQNRVIPLPSDVSGHVTIDLSRFRSSKSGSGKRTFVLEAFSTKEASKDWVRRLSVQLPKLRDVEAPFPLVWQVIVPRTEHLLAGSESLAPLYRWRWHDLFYVRESDWTQSRLEQEFGASTQSLPPEQTNQYAMLSLVQTAPMQIWVVPRPLVWFPTALIIFCVSILMVERRWLRWPWMWVIAIALAVAFSQYAWDLSVVLAHASVGGVTIALVYAMARWLVDRRARRKSIFANRTITITNSTALRPSANSASQLPSGSSVHKGVSPSASDIPQAGGAP